MTREKITWPGATIKKKEQGMPSYDNNNLFGDLFITFDVDFPRSTLDAEEKEGMCYLLYVQLNVHTKLDKFQTAYTHFSLFLFFTSCDKTSKTEVLSNCVQWFMKIKLKEF